MKAEITGLILAGGRGRRVSGQDKGLIPYEGRPLIESAIACLVPQVDQVVISANRNIERYESYGFPVISDQISDFQGPLAGIAAVLPAVNTPLIVVVPCDSGSFPDNLVEKLVQRLSEHPTAEIAYANDGERHQYLHSLLKTSASVSLDEYLKSGQRSVRGWYDDCGAEVVGFPDPEMFKNLNVIGTN